MVWDRLSWSHTQSKEIEVNEPKMDTWNTATDVIRTYQATGGADTLSTWGNRVMEGFWPTSPTRTSGVVITSMELVGRRRYVVHSYDQYYVPRLNKILVGRQWVEVFNDARSARLFAQEWAAERMREAYPEETA